MGFRARWLHWSFYTKLGRNMYFIVSGARSHIPSIEVDFFVSLHIWNQIQRYCIWWKCFDDEKPHRKRDFGVLSTKTQASQSNSYLEYLLHQQFAPLQHSKDKKIAAVSSAGSVCRTALHSVWGTLSHIPSIVLRFFVRSSLKRSWLWHWAKYR